MAQANLDRARELTQRLQSGVMKRVILQSLVSDVVWC